VRSAAATRLRDVIEYTDEPVVSSDVVGNTHSALFDASSTFVLGDTMLKTRDVL